MSLVQLFTDLTRVDPERFTWGEARSERFGFVRSPINSYPVDVESPGFMDTALLVSAVTAGVMARNWGLTANVGPLVIVVVYYTDARRVSFFSRDPAEAYLRAYLAAVQSDALMEAGS